MFFLINGFYPPVVRHSCDNRKCINPEHLIAGTVSDNIQDMIERKRHANYVSIEEEIRCFSLREQGLEYQEIADIMGYKSRRRVEYILTIRDRKAG